MTGFKCVSRLPLHVFPPALTSSSSSFPSLPASSRTALKVTRPTKRKAHERWRLTFPTCADIYPSYLQESKGLSSHQSTVATIIGNVGAIVGGTIAGCASFPSPADLRLPDLASTDVSQFLGRRLTIIVCCLWTCAFIPLWLIPNSFGGLAAGAFMVQMGVQGCVALPLDLALRLTPSTT